jgi:hypothetical protein
MKLLELELEPEQKRLEQVQQQMLMVPVPLVLELAEYQSSWGADTLDGQQPKPPIRRPGPT